MLSWTRTEIMTKIGSEWSPSWNPRWWSVGMIIVWLYFFITMFIRQFPSTFFYVDLSSLWLKVAKSAWKYHKLQSSAKFFPQMGFMGILNMWFLIPCRTKWHQKSFDINFFRVWPKIWVLLPALLLSLPVHGSPRIDMQCTPSIQSSFC